VGVNEPMIPLSDLGRIDEATKRGLTAGFDRVVGSGWFLRGAETTRLEAELTRQVGARAICVANGTDALFLAMSALGVGRGSRVATVGNAGGYTSGAALRLGATPVIIDVSVDDAQMDPQSLERALDSPTPPDVVVMTHLYGQVGDVERVAVICSAAGVPLVEDCAQAFGASVRGQPVGSFGQLATTSFYPSKNLGAFGDGGAVFTQTDELADSVASLAQYGWGNRFHVERFGGINSRLDEIQAMVLSTLLKGLPARNERRRELCRRYADSLPEGRRLIGTLDERFVGHLAVMVTEHRDHDREHLRQHGVQTGIHYPVLDHLQAAWLGRIESHSVPNTEWLSSRVLTIPCFPEMTEQEVDIVSRALARL
jgi:dTDP-4-amino-4,6-dideoxygalactose transaminase